MYKGIKNIGIFAHVDAGKTTLTEQLLYQTGTIRTLGSVDGGNTVTDAMSLERERGISIQSTPVSFTHQDHKINIIDTPGHVDFVAEVERSMLALDAAILVISAKEGIQSHTRLLYRTLMKRKVPLMIVVNKIDRLGVNLDEVIHQIRNELTNKVFFLNYPSEVESKEASIVKRTLSVEDGQYEEVIMNHDGLLEAYLINEVVEENQITSVLKNEVKDANWSPICFASAMHGIGVKEVLAALIEWLPNFEPVSTNLSGIVFKVKRHHLKTKETYVKVTGGVMRFRGMLGEDKVSRIATFTNGETPYVGELHPGEIGIVSGLHHLNTCDVFGDQEAIELANITKPTLQVSINPVRLSERSRLLDALSVLSEEDPYVMHTLSSINDTIKMQICGVVQLEIIKEQLFRRFGLDVDFSLPEPVYMERINGSATEMIRRCQDGLPFYAGIGFTIHPLPLMSGVQFESKISNGFLRQTFQNGVRDGAISHLQQGLKGWELVDMKIEFDDFEYDSVMSTPKEFRDLAPLVLFEAIKKVGTHLLWPLYNFTLIVPVEHIGRALRDISAMKGVYDEPIVNDRTVLITGKIPVEKCMNYHKDLVDYTSGLGVFDTTYGGYEVAPDDIQACRGKFKVDPGNRGEYLLDKLGVR